jgi:hypothetical protein
VEIVAASSAENAESSGNSSLPQVWIQQSSERRGLRAPARMRKKILWGRRLPWHALDPPLNVGSFLGQ